MFVSGCAYTIKPTTYSSLSELMNAMNEHTRPLSSMKALASISIKINNREAQFPEGIIMNGKAMRLETLNIFYQPVLIIVYNDMVAVMDVGTDACSISSAALLRQYTRIDVEPEIFERLITAQLIDKPDKMLSAKNGIALYGAHNDTRWVAWLDNNLNIISSTVRQSEDNPINCVYGDYDMSDGVAFPKHVTCKSGKNVLIIRYRKVRVNVPVDPSLTDIQKLCGTGFQGN